ncbi:hypothetical protein U1Q18_052686 [Sarracenia purpurea var. burkii]
MEMRNQPWATYTKQWTEQNWQLSSIADTMQSTGKSLIVGGASSYTMICMLLVRSSILIILFICLFTRIHKLYILINVILKNIDRILFKSPIPIWNHIIPRNRKGSAARNEECDIQVGAGH